MPSIHAETLLATWEEGASQTSVVQGLLLLALACPEQTDDQLANASIGERDGQLLELRQALFGARLETTATCPRCAERLEVNFDTHQIRLGVPSRGDLCLEREGLTLTYRLPTSADLLAVAQRQGTEIELLQRCIVKAEQLGAPLAATEIPAPVQQAVAEAMAQADPQADVQIKTTCSACSFEWPILFDIVSHLWSDLEEWAQRMLADVHVLASAYGWSERDILALHPRRRRLYIEMAGAE